MSGYPLEGAVGVSTAGCPGRYASVMWANRRFPTPPFMLLLLVGALGACQSTGPKSLEIPADQYEVAFDAAREATREVGMPALMADRTGGVIESRPRLAGSILEPWRVDNSGSQWLTSTLHKQRRRVRFEFLPVDFSPADPTGVEELVGPPLPGSGEEILRSVDLDSFDGPIEVRVWVWIEREQGAELRRSTWTRRGRSYAQDPSERDSQSDGTTRSPGIWTPVERDTAMERRLLAEVEAALGKSAGNASG